MRSQQQQQAGILCGPVWILAHHALFYLMDSSRHGCASTSQLHQAFIKINHLTVRELEQRLTLTLFLATGINNKIQSFSCFLSIIYSNFQSFFYSSSKAAKLRFAVLTRFAENMLLIDTFVHAQFVFLALRLHMLDIFKTQRQGTWVFGRLSCLCVLS